MREASLRLDVHLWIKVASVSLKISENLKILYSFRILCCEGTNKSILFLLFPVTERSVTF